MMRSTIFMFSASTCSALQISSSAPGLRTESVSPMKEGLLDTPPVQMEMEREGAICCIPAEKMDRGDLASCCIKGGCIVGTVAAGLACSSFGGIPLHGIQIGHGCVIPCAKACLMTTGEISSGVAGAGFGTVAGTEAMAYCCCCPNSAKVPAAHKWIGDEIRDACSKCKCTDGCC